MVGHTRKLIFRITFRSPRAQWVKWTSRIWAISICTLKQQSTIKSKPYAHLLWNTDHQTSLQELTCVMLDLFGKQKYVQQALEIFPHWRQKPILHNQYHGCWWPGDISRQGISNHGIVTFFWNILVSWRFQFLQYSSMITLKTYVMPGGCTKITYAKVYFTQPHKQHPHRDCL